MARNPFNYLDLRVSDMGEALPFYKMLMPLLGFDYEGRRGTRRSALGIFHGKQRSAQSVLRHNSRQSERELPCLLRQMIDDLQTLMKLLDRQAAGEDVTRELDELENAIDVKIALTGGLRR